MTLESLINFHRGQWVQLNNYKVPWAGEEYGLIKSIEITRRYVKEQWKEVKSGKIVVQWESGIETLHYSCLRIAPDDVQYRLTKAHRYAQQKQYREKSI